MKKFVLIALFSLMVFESTQAFRSTSIKGFTDPDFIGHKVDNIIACLAPDFKFNAIREIDTKLRQESTKRNFKYQLCEEHFPPTRNWTIAMQLEILSHTDIDAMLYFTSGSYESGGYTSQLDTEVRLLDPKTGLTIWLGRITIDNKGAAFMGLKGNVKVLVDLVIKDLISKNHL